MDPGPGLQWVIVDKGEAALEGSGWGIVISTVGEVPRDPCDTSAGAFPAEEVSTPDGVAEAMASWPGYSATPAAPVTFEGASGVVFDMTTTDAWLAVPLKCTGHPSWARPTTATR